MSPSWKSFGSFGERDLKCFEEKSFDMENVVSSSKVKFYPASWVSSLPSFQDIPIATILRRCLAFFTLFAYSSFHDLLLR